MTGGAKGGEVYSIAVDASDANCLTPSAIDTELLGGVTQEYLDTVVLSKMPIGRLGRPEEAAEAVY